MIITNVEHWTEHSKLIKPYTIAYETYSEVENHFVRIETESGSYGLGAASPDDYVTGETRIDCKSALDSCLESLLLGGIFPALQIAEIAHLANIDLMWGCMDESIVSISAALDAALASPATRYVDLDGSFNLARDLVEGGFRLKDGELTISDQPGLGVNLK